MKPFTCERGPAVVLPLDNVDTDQLIPARFMTRSRAAGYGDLLLHDLRYDAAARPRPDFPLNAVRAPVFLLAGRNFGCGSSREAAVYALQDYGFRAVLAPGFADIFAANALKNGLLPAELAPHDHAALAAALAASPELVLAVDLEAGRVAAGALSLPFRLDPASRGKLLLGLDEISETLAEEEAIRAFETRREAERPWLLPRRT